MAKIAVKIRALPRARTHLLSGGEQNKKKTENLRRSPTNLTFFFFSFAQAVQVREQINDEKRKTNTTTIQKKLNGVHRDAGR